MASAASGQNLPTLQLTLAYVRATGGDESAWQKRWLQVANAVTEQRAVSDQGVDALAAFVEASQDSSDRQWRSKLLFVGEGGAGKTSLLKALLSIPRNPAEPTTHGLNIAELPLPHPLKSGITMRLSCWDFGGQHVYHATHQFFLTDQSLFLLVWNARSGWDRASARYWLDIVAARTGGRDEAAAPVLLVATQSDGRAPDLPLSELRRDYPNIIGSLQTDSFTGQGVDDVRDAVAEHAATLPLMGSQWPKTWLDARQAVREAGQGRNHMGVESFNSLLSAAGVTDANGQAAVTGTMHRLGEILHFADDPDLSGTVVLSPAWLSQRIAAILDCSPVAARHGLLRIEDVQREWADVAKEFRTQLLYLMDSYGVSYRITDSNDSGAKAVVVDRLPWEAPDFQADWNAALSTPGGTELRLLYTIAGTVPPGIPSWFIARAHRFAHPRHRPWRTGVLLAHHDGRHLGLLQSEAASGTLSLAVRGPRPAGFLGLLDLEFVEATLRRYPGLRVTRHVPCSCQPGCPSTWPYDTLVRRQLVGQSQVQCDSSDRYVDIAALVDGITPARTPAEDPTILMAQVSRIEAAVHQTYSAVMRQEELLREDADLRHLEFARLMGWLQVSVPTVFTVTKRSKHLPGAARYTLRLYCAEPNAVHQLPDNQGCYTVTALDDWTAALAKHLTTVAALLSTVTGLSGVLGDKAPELLKRNAEDLKKLHEFLAHVKEGAASVSDRTAAGDLPTSQATTEADMRKLEELLRRLDPQRHWGGLTKTVTPGGLTLYLCQDHARSYTAPVRRPQGL